MPYEYGINDLWMGTMDRRIRCWTCNGGKEWKRIGLTLLLDEKECTGHIGMIKLVRPVWHCGYLDVCAKILSSICHNCGRLKLNKDIRKREYEQCKRIKNNVNWLNAIYKISKDVKICGTWNREDNSYVNGCGHTHSKIKKGFLKITQSFP